MDSMEIRPEYTGTDPNLHPAASAFARLIKSVTNADGTFMDPDLEAEFTAWTKERRRPADGANAGGPKRKEVLLHEL